MKKKLHFLFTEIKNIILAGLFLLLPISFTIFILIFLFTKLDGMLSPTATQVLIFFGADITADYRAPGLGVVATLIILFLTGILTRIYLGRKIVALGEFIVKKIPFVSSLYGSAKHVIDSITKTDNTSFRRVVLIEFPKKDSYAIAFVTSETEGEIQLVTGKKVLTVFVPTTPNPTSGYLLFVPEQEITPLIMSVEEGMKLVISAGLVNPAISIEEIKKIRMEKGI
ncbi:MAG: DUF502 domain-containing protein [Nitrospinae bacterium]|nr:DUF502 domain-containing protein [Nitrospinota bacterium]